MVMGITTSGNNLFVIGRLGPFTIGLDFLKRKGLARSSSNKDGSKNMYGWNSYTHVFCKNINTKNILNGDPKSNAFR